MDDQADSRRSRRAGLPATLALVVLLATPGARNRASAMDDGVFPLIKPEQTRLLYHHPDELPHIPIPESLRPPTLLEDRSFRGTRLISLDEAIAIALQNSEVIRVFTGAGAGSSGRTIYDTAIANQAIDQQRAAFDPQLNLSNTWSQIEPPAGALFQTVPGDPFSPVDADIVGSQTENLNTTFGLSQRNLAGGVASYRFSNDRTFISPGGGFALNPQRRFFNEVGYTQPLLRGAGVTANRVPIVLARIDAERTFFQLSGSVQDLVRGVIDAYWRVVFERTNVWARTIQAEQVEESYKRAVARKKVDLADVTEVAQTRSALANFRAQLLTAEGQLLQAEAALLNVLGLPPTLATRLVPTTRPVEQRVEIDWTESVRLAESRRPDLIELKLVLEADRQRLLQSRNASQPTLDAVAQYRWNGIVGETPAGRRRSSNGSQFTDWTLGINFAVPLGLRAERAGVRSSELLIARDRANLAQGLHNTQHILAANLRTLDQAYLQYEAFQEAREAAREFLEAQFAAYRNEREQVLFLNVLQAISDFGNAVSQEASALLQYNTTLANLERETGTILETHGVYLLEDLDCAIGPHCLRVGKNRDRRGRLYTTGHHPSANSARYLGSDEPAEQAFDLDDAPKRRGRGAGKRTDSDVIGTPLRLPAPNEESPERLDIPSIEPDTLPELPPVDPAPESIPADDLPPESGPQKRPGREIKPRRPSLRQRLLGR